MYKILVADDEKLVRDGLRHLLETSGRPVAVVAEAETGAQAIEQAREHAPDIIFMDVRMPELDGLQAVEEITRLIPQSKIVMLTAYAEFEYARQAIRLGALEYLLKPTRTDDILRLVDELIAKRESEKRKEELDALARKELDAARPYMEMEFIGGLVNGTFTSVEDLASHAGLLGLAEVPSVALAISLDQVPADVPGEAGRQLVKHQAYEAITGALRGVPGGIASYSPGDEILALFSTRHLSQPGQAREFALRIAHSLVKVVTERTAAMVAVGVGRTYDDVLRLHFSIAEAQRALQQRMFSGDTAVIHIDEVEAPTELRFSQMLELENKLGAAVRLGNGAEAEGVLAGVLQILVSRPHVSPDRVKLFFLQLLTVLSRAAVEGGADPDLVGGETLQRAREIEGQTTLEGIGGWIRGCLQGLVQAVVQERRTRSRDLLSRAKEYVRTNYARELTLDEMAVALRVSPFHFSRMFKQASGQTFTDYLTSTRIRESKSLLANTDLSVAEVAFRVGYGDQSHFGQVFKRLVGCSPFSFRRQARRERPGSDDADG